MMERAALTIAQAVQAGAGSRSTIYEAINKGRLRARKRGRSTIILAEDLSAFLQSLPAIEPKTAAQHEPDGNDVGRRRGCSQKAGKINSEARTVCPPKRPVVNRPHRRQGVVPFPLARRRALIVGLAAQMAARPMALAEKHLQQQLRRQAGVMRRRGVTPAVIEREIRALESAVRIELWRVVLLGSQTPPGAA